MKVDSPLDYMRLVKTISYHNNLDIGLIEQLYNKGALVSSTKNFWRQHERSVTGNIIELEIPTYRYSYMHKNDNRPVTYGDMTASELKQAVKSGIVIKQAHLKGYKKMQIANLEDTSGKTFDTSPYDIQLLELMKKLQVYELNNLINELMHQCNIEKSIERDMAYTLESLLDTGVMLYIPKDIENVELGLVKIFSFIDTVIQRKKLIDIKKQALDEIADIIICSIEAKNVRMMMGGVD